MRATIRYALMPKNLVTLFCARHLVAGLFMLVPLLSPAAAQAKSALARAERHEVRHEIDQLEQSWKDAVIKRDLRVMDNLLADDYIGITSSGTLQSKQETLDNLKSGTTSFHSIEFSDRKVRFYGKTALVTSRAEIIAKTGEGDISGSYRFTRVYVRNPEGDWKVVSFEASRIREGSERR